MKTHRHDNTQSSVPSTPNTDAQRLADFDDLVRRASQGDRRAINAVAIAFSTDLLKEAQAVMGGFAQDAEDVVQDFFVMLLEARSQFTPAHGRAIPWMCGIVRAMARKHRANRRRDWGRGNGP
jgi:DNA-directed RNA polymerase specialized sigma24 family protein